MARSRRFIAICHCRFLASLKNIFKHGKKTALSTFHCNQLQHTRWACFKTDLPDHFRFNLFKSLLSHAGQLSCCDVTEVTWPKTGFSAADEASCLFSFKSILLRTWGKCQSIKRTACMLNFTYVVQSKWYLRLKISVQGPFKEGTGKRCSECVMPLVFGYN